MPASIGVLPALSVALFANGMGAEPPFSSIVTIAPSVSPAASASACAFDFAWATAALSAWL